VQCAATSGNACVRLRGGPQVACGAEAAAPFREDNEASRLPEGGHGPSTCAGDPGRVAIAIVVAPVVVVLDPALVVRANLFLYRAEDALRSLVPGGSGASAGPATHAQASAPVPAKPSPVPDLGLILGKVSIIMPLLEVTRSATINRFRQTVRTVLTTNALAASVASFNSSPPVASADGGRTRVESSEFLISFRPRAFPGLLNYAGASSPFQAGTPSVGMSSEGRRPPMPASGPAAGVVILSLEVQSVRVSVRGDCSLAQDVTGAPMGAQQLDPTVVARSLLSSKLGQIRAVIYEVCDSAVSIAPGARGVPAQVTPRLGSSGSGSGAGSAAFTPHLVDETVVGWSSGLHVSWSRQLMSIPKVQIHVETSTQVKGGVATASARSASGRMGMAGVGVGAGAGTVVEGAAGTGLPGVPGIGPGLLGSYSSTGAAGLDAGRSTDPVGSGQKSMQQPLDQLTTLSLKVPHVHIEVADMVVLPLVAFGNAWKEALGVWTTESARHRDRMQQRRRTRHWNGDATEGPTEQPIGGLTASASPTTQEDENGPQSPPTGRPVVPPEGGQEGDSRGPEGDSSPRPGGASSPVFPMDGDAYEGVGARFPTPTVSGAPIVRKSVDVSVSVGAVYVVVLHTVPVKRAAPSTPAKVARPLVVILMSRLMGSVSHGPSGVNFSTHLRQLIAVQGDHGEASHVDPQRASSGQGPGVGREVPVGARLASGHARAAHLAALVQGRAPVLAVGVPSCEGATEQSQARWAATQSMQPAVLAKGTQTDGSRRTVVVQLGTVTTTLRFPFLFTVLSVVQQLQSTLADEELRFRNRQVGAAKLVRAAGAVPAPSGVFVPQQPSSLAFWNQLRASVTNAALSESDPWFPSSAGPVTADGVFDTVLGVEVDVATDGSPALFNAPVVECVSEVSV
jgi:hypothetical protein